MKWRPDQLDIRAVLGPVKAWPGSAEASDKASATASLDEPCARRAAQLQAGTEERSWAQTKEQHKMRKELLMR
jgi:hypothetical protein